MALKALIKRYQTTAVVGGCLALALLMFVASDGMRSRTPVVERPILMGVGKIQSHHDFVSGNASNFWDR